MAGPTKPAQKTGAAVPARARRKSIAPWIHTLERFGFVIRGVIYIVIGLLALLLAVSAGGAATSPTSAIVLIGKQPFGMVFLTV